jgi:hypothetical protein
MIMPKMFKTTVTGIGPFCVEFGDGEIITTRSEARQKLLAASAELLPLLIEARDALPAISMASARLHNVDLSLADRIERALERWRVE